MRPADPYVVTVMRGLFPDRGEPRFVRVTGRSPADGLDWWVLPSPQRARLLLPVGRPAAAVMLTRHGGGVRRAARRLGAAIVRSRLVVRLPLPRVRLGPRVGADDGATLEDLVNHLGGDGSSVGVILGTPRLNRKPVLQVFDPDGTARAFVKVGTDAATAALVEREATCLRRVLSAGLRLVQPPHILHAGRVGGLEVLALEPLSSSQKAGRRERPEPPLEAMAEVAGSQGVWAEPLASSRFWNDITRQAAQVPGRTLRERIEVVLGQVESAFGTTELTMGSWHGDWAPWNMGTAAGQVQVWDWERFASAVPWGLDVVHFLAQRVRHGSTDRAVQERELLEELPRLLRRTGRQGCEQDPTLLLLAYLVAICLRFATAATAATAVGAPGPDVPHPRAQWALELAERVLRDRQALQ